MTPSTMASTPDTHGTTDVLMWALQPYLNAEQAHQAARLWTLPDGASSSALAGLGRYCNTVARHFDLRGREAELHLRLFKAMQWQIRQRQGAASVPPPSRPAADSLPGTAMRTVPPVSAGSGLTVQRFLEVLLQFMGRELAAPVPGEAWRQGLLKQARRLPTPLQHALRSWLWLETPTLAGDWPAQGAGTRLLNAAYVVAAEWLGPVKADACFTATVRELESSGDPVLARVRHYL